MFLSFNHATAIYFLHVLKTEHSYPLIFDGISLYAIFYYSCAHIKINQMDEEQRLTGKPKHIYLPEEDRADD